MNWSFSAQNIVRKCSRRAFFKYKMASWNAKDEMRREVYLLNQLQSVSAWRGQLVDTLIEKRVVPNLIKGTPVNIDEIVEDARIKFDSQLAFAKERKFRLSNMKKSGNDDYLALFSLEYEMSKEEFEEQLHNAWQEVQKAFHFFLEDREIFHLVKQANKVLPQQKIHFKVEGYPVLAIPDLILLFHDRPPLIIDWKVHYFGHKSYHRQLALYGLALSSWETFNSQFIQKYTVDEYSLLEAQLLLKKERWYTLSDQILEESKNDVIASCLELEILGFFKKYDELFIEDFPTTQFPENCEYCPFKRVCNNYRPELLWKREFTQMSLPF